MLCSTSNEERERRNMRASVSYRASLARAQASITRQAFLDLTSALRRLLRVLLSCLQHHAASCCLTPRRQLLYYAATLPEASRHFSLEAESQRAAGRFGVCEAKRKSLQLTDPEVAPLESHRCLCRINNAADKLTSSAPPAFLFSYLLIQHLGPK